MAVHMWPTKAMLITFSKGAVHGQRLSPFLHSRSRLRLLIKNTTDDF